MTAGPARTDRTSPSNASPASSGRRRPRATPWPKPSSRCGPSSSATHRITPVFAAWSRKPSRRRSSNRCAAAPRKSSTSSSTPRSTRGRGRPHRILRLPPTGADHLRPARGACRRPGAVQVVVARAGPWPRSRVPAVPAGHRRTDGGDRPVRPVLLRAARRAPDGTRRRPAERARAGRGRRHRAQRRRAALHLHPLARRRPRDDGQPHRRRRARRCSSTRTSAGSSATTRASSAPVSKRCCASCHRCS